MTTFADGEVVVAESPLAVMTSSTALTASGRVMIERLRRRDLSSLGHSGTHLVTIVAVCLRVVLGVAEAHIEGRHVLRGSRIATQLVTRTARRNVASA